MEVHLFAKHGTVINEIGVFSFDRFRASLIGNVLDLMQLDNKRRNRRGG